MNSPNAPEAVVVPSKASPAPRPDDRPKRPPPHAVVLHNDHVNTFDHVIRTLQKVFGYGGFQAIRMTLAAHTTGRSQVWTGPLEVAELKAEQIRACGPDPAMVSFGAEPLSVSVEPLPSDD